MHKNEVTKLSELYERIEDFCKERKVNITQMCREANVPRAALTDLKMGRSKELSIKTLERIADYFNVSVDTIIGKEQKETPYSSGIRASV
jgi:transcriptional regulator with XRE-family HTH domain